MEVEAKKMQREVAAKEKEVAAIRISRDHDQRMRPRSTPRGAVGIMIRGCGLEVLLGGL